MKDLKPIRLSGYSGRNAFSDITNLGPTEFREIENFDIYSGMAGDYLRVRRGSNWLIPEEGPDTMPDLDNQIVFPTPDGEFLIMADTNNGFLFACPLPGNPARIYGPFWEITTSVNLVSLSLDGVPSPYILYYLQSHETGTVTIAVFSDEEMENLVAQGSIMESEMEGEITLSEENDSGISGTVYITDTSTGDEEEGVFGLSTIDIDSGIMPDFEVYNDRVYVFAQSGNLILYYDAEQGRIVGRPMGLNAPTLEANSPDTTPGDMPPNATYTYGIESLIYKDGADYVASSPNRNLFNGTISSVSTGGYSSVGLQITSGFTDDPYWTHLRLWRSKNQTVDLSDPLSPIDAQGTPDVLYEVALITRAEIEGTLGAIDYGDGLPPGNVGVEAGVSSGDYVVIDKNDDSVLVKAIGLDLIGLIPIPGCRTGTVNKGRIWASGIGDDFIAPEGPNIDPVIREDWLYTTEQFSQYQEQWDPQAYLVAGRDGERTESLLTLLEDVIGFRSSTTRRVASGNPASLVQMLDSKIGVPSFRCTGYIPQIGICAICSDGYFRYFGFDEQWHQYIGKTEISQSIYDLTAAVLDENKADFVYMNGKLIMLLPSGDMAALGVKEGKGWSLYDYNQTFDVAFNFGKGNRAAGVNGGSYIIEIETSDDTDAFGGDLETTYPIVGAFEGFAFSGQGKLLEVLKYSFWGKLSAVPTITAKSSGKTWRVSSGFIDPGLFAANDTLNEREYIFTPEPLDTTPFKWVPLRGQFLTFSLSVTGPAMISWQEVKARVRDTNGDLGVFPDGGFIPQGPGWAQFAYYTLNFEDPADTFYDASGKGQNYEWGGVGTKTNRVTQKPVKGLKMEPGEDEEEDPIPAFISRATDTACLAVGVRNMVFKAVFSLLAGGYFITTGRSSGFFYHLDVNETRAILTATNGTLKYSYTSTFAFAVGGVYVLSFYLKSDLTGSFWYDLVGATSFSGPRSTIRDTSTMTAPDTGATVSIDGIVSFYEVLKSAWGNDQAKRFWGEVKAY